MAKALRPVYTAPTEAAAKQRFAEFADAWATRYPAVIRLRANAWAEFVPFLAFDTEIRKVVCSTNAIESVNARIRRAVRARGHFPTNSFDRPHQGQWSIRYWASVVRMAAAMLLMALPLCARTSLMKAW
jgi:transposase-like protein